MRVVGLVEPRQGAGAFWPFQDLSDELLARTDTVQLLLGPTGILPLEMASWYSVLDLRGLTAAQVPQTVRTLRHLGTEVAGAVPGAQLGVSPLPVLQSFLFRQQALVALLRVMSIPATALLLAFLILTAWLVVDSQAVEIAVLTSRGARRGQIVGIYLLEWVLLALPAAGLAPLLALGVARVVGSTRGFLDFAPGSPLPGGLAWSDWAQALAAVGVAVLTALVPVLLRCRGVLPGVQQQQARAPGWAAGQRVPAEGVVAVLLALGWLWARQATVRTGGLGAIVKSPGLFLLPVGLMLLGALVAERLVRQLARALERGSGRRLPALVLLPLRRLERRTHRSAGILALILFTAGSATYTATVATALIRNLASATGYRVGAQVRLLQTSPCLTLPLLSGVCATYDPVFPRLAGGEVRPLPPFSLNLRPGGVRTATEMPELGVQAYPSGAGAMRSANQRANAAATLVLVDPQGYGRTVSWQPSWMPLPEGTYLRLLERPDGVLVSPAVGAAGERLLVADGGSNAEFSILGTVPRWPGADISGNLVLANLAGARALLHLTCGPEPCIGSRVVLMDLRPGASLGAIQTELQGYGLYSLATDDAGSELATALASPEWTGTTGLLTLGFVVALLLMAVGYYMVAEIMVRWDASELALLRSLGLGRAGTWLQLVLEHLGLVLAGAAGGLGAGWAACSLFLPLLRPAFSGPNAPPFLLVGPGSVLGPLALALVLMLAATFLAFVWLLRNLALEERLREAA